MSLTEKLTEHTIITDNKIMAGLGLNDFSIQSLYDWIVKYDFNNMSFIKGVIEPGGTPWKWDQIRDNPASTATKEEKAIAAMNLLLGYASSANAWRQSQPDIKDYEIATNRTGNLTDRSAELETFKGLAYKDSKNDWSYDNYTYSDLSLETYKSFFRKNDDDGARVDWDNYAISRIIGLNTEINRPGSLGGDTQDAASAKFIRDIRQSNGLQWTVKLKIIIPDTSPLVECEIDVNWTLILRGRDAPVSKVTPALVDPVIAKAKTNEMGTKYSGRDQDLRLQPNLNQDEQSSKVAGELDTHYNEWTGKFESGTKQIIAVLTTDLVGAIPPNDGMISDPLVYNDKDTGFRVTHGRAMPITMKGTNPTKWSPEWKNLAGCDSADEECEVLQIPVQNKLLSSFNKGDTVILNKIGGIWQPSAISSGVAGVTDPPISADVGKWSFVSLMSNAAHYFWSNTGGGARVLYDFYETAMYNKYYDKTQTNANQLGHDANGYIQVSSFDMMGPSVGGTRDNHAISRVSVEIKNDGTAYNTNPQDLNPFETSPFFGAYFPDGYNLGDKFAKYTTPLETDVEFTAYGKKGLNDIGYQVDVGGQDTIFNAADGAHIFGSPFATVAQNDTRLNHLPADIALNANPDSENGQPLTVISSIHDMFNAPTTSQGMQLAINNIMGDVGKRFAWLADKNDNKTAMFDLNPINKTRVVFRPLKNEVYCTFEQVAGLPNTQNNDIRGHFSTKIIQQMTDSQPVISLKAINRVVSDINVDDGIWGASVGLQHQKDLAGHINRPGSNSAFPQQFFFNTWANNELPADSKPSSAFGIIGAQCTVTANTSITFETANNIGMDDYIINVGLGSSFGGAGQFVNTNILGRYYSSFGGDSDTYYSRNNSLLMARVFHEHPRELTVYDPRFFAVFHFASGIGQDIRKEYFIGNEEVVEDPNQPQKTIVEIWNDDPGPHAYDPGATGVDSNGDPLPGKWQRDVSDFAVTDFREPTLIDAAANPQLGVVANVGTDVYKNDSGDNNATPPRAESKVWREADDWLVNDGFRGKLLPYEGTRKTVGISSIRVTDDSNGTFGVNGGKDYKDTDIFTTKGGEGSGVLLNPTVNGDGTITGFTVVDQGYDFEPKDFFTEHEITNDEDKYSAAKVTIALDTLTSTGQGFKAYVQNGQVREKTGETIAAPGEINPNQREILLTPKSPFTQNGGGSRQTRTTSSKPLTVQISQPSSNKKYDVFLHYHNDISHVWHEAAYDSVSARPTEQFIDLTISPA